MSNRQREGPGSAAARPEPGFGKLNQPTPNLPPEKLQELIVRLTESRERLRTLDCLLDWRVSLLARSRRAQLVFELVDTDTDLLDSVAEEMSEYTRIIRAMTWQPEASIERRSA
jgi:hypothetical protein